MKVLAYTSPATGHLFPIVPVLAELQSHGHVIAVRTLENYVAPLRDLDLAADPIDERIATITHDDYLAKNPVGSLKKSTAVFAKRAPLEASDLRAAIAAEQPDVLLIDTNCWGAAAVAEHSGLPWASFLPFPAPLPGAGIPPFGPGLAPAHNLLGRARDAVLRPLVTGSVERSVLPVVNEIRQAEGVRPLSGATDLFTSPPLTIYLSAEPFEYRRTDWPASFRLVGPVSYEPPAQAPSWLTEIDRPIVLVTTSSEFQDDGRLVSATLEGLRGEDVFVVATLPSGDPGALEVPANARVERWLPHSAVLARAVCAVTHGGMGATQKALAAGVPVVAVPFGRDQLEVARRVEISGAGVRLPLSKLTPTRVRHAVRDARMRTDQAMRLGAQLGAAGGAAKAASEIETLAKNWYPASEAGSH